jgi:hypothetical protein
MIFLKNSRLRRTLSKAHAGNVVSGRLTVDKRKTYLKTHALLNSNMGF